MEKRHRRGLSKQAVSDSYFSSLALIRFWVFDCKLNEQGGELLSVSSRPPAVENLGLFWGGGGDHFKITPLDLGFKICFNFVSNSSFNAKGSRLS